MPTQFERSGPRLSEDAELDFISNTFANAFTDYISFTLVVTCPLKVKRDVAAIAGPLPLSWYATRYTGISGRDYYDDYYFRYFDMRRPPGQEKVETGHQVLNHKHDGKPNCFRCYKKARKALGRICAQLAQVNDVWAREVHRLIRGKTRTADAQKAAAEKACLPYEYRLVVSADDEAASKVAHAQFEIDKVLRPPSDALRVAKALVIEAQALAATKEMRETWPRSEADGELPSMFEALDEQA